MVIGIYKTFFMSLIAQNIIHFKAPIVKSVNYIIFQQKSLSVYIETITPNL